MKRLVFLSLLALLPTPALAAPTVAGEAVVHWTHGVQDKIIVDETIWRCSGDTCSGQLAENGPTLQRTCRKLAQGAGWVDSFRTPSQSFGAEELTRCNRGRSPQAARVNTGGESRASN